MPDPSLPGTLWMQNDMQPLMYFGQAILGVAGGRARVADGRVRGNNNDGSATKSMHMSPEPSSER